MRNGIILGCLLGVLTMSFVGVQITLGQGATAQAGGESITCPNCKTETLATKKGGGVHLETRMLCPNCKGKGTALEPHVCNKCGQEVLLCDLCKKVVARVVEKPTAQVKCPNCKERVTVTKKGGGVHLEKAMECPSCKKKVEGLEAIECERCGKEMLSCPICRQHVGSVVKKVPAVELKCPSCKEMTQATKKGGGVHLEKTMVCPNCKMELKDADIHTCSKCGAEMATCPLCNKPM